MDSITDAQFAGRPPRVLNESLSPRLQSLFHHSAGDEPKCHRRLEKIYTNPAIYLVRNFLSPVDIDYLDRNITQHSDKFQASFTEDENGNKCVSEERTSEYIFLDKGRDTTIRSLETRAAGKIFALFCVYLAFNLSFETDLTSMYLITPVRL